MTNAADIAADEVRGFSVDLERFSADIADRILSMLMMLEAELIALLTRLDLNAVSRADAKLARKRKLLQQTQETIATHYSKARNAVHSDLREVASLSSKNARVGINTAVGVEIATTALAPERLRAMVDGTMIQGAPSKQWWKDQAATTLRNFTNEVQKGYASGEGAAEIARRVRGTEANGFTDGVMDISRRNAIALIRTSVQAISNSARNETFENNDDIIENLQQISTLDGRTTIICKARSGLQWNLKTKEPVGHLIPWNGGAPLHFQCRSVNVAVLKPLNKIPSKKRKSVEEVGTQASMDGQVPGDMDYDSWLKTKSEEFQKDALGFGKWKLWKAGKVTLPQMLDMRGNPMTLAELQRKYG
jgi:SPP1 gp7 family putative phage head morphogenesis protein